ncbi:hypothetical protein [Paraburkholderia panacisoli]|uniref:hypothetical protein n=1 Tax=Paraburkholderia panacisoli TaxID=2603818 RepID=UPI00165ECD96|nr:hypothetical protein [Paraburkholderia panacisoli]
MYPLITSPRILRDVRSTCSIPGQDIIRRKGRCSATGATCGDLRVAEEQLVIAGEQIAAERIVDLLVIVEAAVETFDLLGGHRTEEVLVEVGADKLTATLLEAGVVEFLKERREGGRDDRIENEVGTAGHDFLTVS